MTSLKHKMFIACEQAPSDGEKKNSASEASGSRNVNPRAKRVGHTPSLPDFSGLVPLALDYTWLARPKPNREPVRRLFLHCLNGSSQT